MGEAVRCGGLPQLTPSRGGGPLRPNGMKPPQRGGHPPLLEQGIPSQSGLGSHQILSKRRLPALPDQRGTGGWVLRAILIPPQPPSIQIFSQLFFFLELAKCPFHLQTRSPNLSSSRCPTLWLASLHNCALETQSLGPLPSSRLPPSGLHTGSPLT